LCLILSIYSTQPDLINKLQDSNTLRKGLRILNAGVEIDPRDAGLRTWSMLMQMIGRCHDNEELCNVVDDDAKSATNTFDDLMLREWARKYLILNHKIPSFLNKEEASQSSSSSSPEKNASGYFRNQLEQSWSSSSSKVMIKNDNSSIFLQVGGLIRGSSATRSPFLLSNQEFHKSIVLILQDDEHFNVGVILNHVTAYTIDFEFQVVTESNGPRQRQDDKIMTLSLPLHYGGSVRIKNDDEGEEGEENSHNIVDSLLFIHMHPMLKQENIGEPIGNNDDADSIYRCTAHEMVDAIATGMAKPKDFMAIDGFCIWEKQQKQQYSSDGSGGGGDILEQIQNGKFEIVTPLNDTNQRVWDVLTHLEPPSEVNTLDNNLHLMNIAWNLAGAEKRAPKKQSDEHVYKSNVKVSTLGDDALKTWVAAFLLEDPSALEP